MALEAGEAREGTHLAGLFAEEYTDMFEGFFEVDSAYKFIDSTSEAIVRFLNDAGFGDFFGPDGSTQYACVIFADTTGKQGADSSIRITETVNTIKMEGENPNVDDEWIQIFSTRYRSFTDKAHINFGDPDNEMKLKSRLHVDSGIVSYNSELYVGQHTGSDNASILADSSKSWTVDELIGFMIHNITDGSKAVITDNDATTVTGTLSGGTDNDWDEDDRYYIENATFFEWVTQSTGIDSLFIAVDNVSKTLHLIDEKNRGTDYGVSAFDDPAFVIHSSDTGDTDQMLSLRWDDTYTAARIISHTSNLILESLDDFVFVNGIGLKVTRQATNYTATLRDDIILVDANAASRTITLPTSGTPNGKIYWIKKVDGSSNTVTIDPSGSVTVDWDDDWVLSGQNDVLQVVYYYYTSGVYYILNEYDGTSPPE